MRSDRYRMMTGRAGLSALIMAGMLSGGCAATLIQGSDATSTRVEQPAGPNGTTTTQEGGLNLSLREASGIPSPVSFVDSAQELEWSRQKDLEQVYLSRLATLEKQVNRAGQAEVCLKLAQFYASQLRDGARALQYGQKALDHVEDARLIGPENESDAHFRQAPLAAMDEGMRQKQGAQAVDTAKRNFYDLIERMALVTLEQTSFLLGDDAKAGEYRKRQSGTGLTGKVPLPLPKPLARKPSAKPSHSPDASSSGSLSLENDRSTPSESPSLTTLSEVDDAHGLRNLPERRSEKSQVSVPDFTAIFPMDARKRHFISFFVPFIEKENRRLLEERHRVQMLQARYQGGESLSVEEYRWLGERAESFRVESTLAENGNGFFRDLLSRIDLVPVSLILAQGIAESAWGTSRFARAGYNYFGHMCNTPGCGIVPRERRPGNRNEAKRFETPEDSILAHIEALNTKESYQGFRDLRVKLRQKGGEITGVGMLPGLSTYAATGHRYLRYLEQIFEENTLTRFDKPRRAENQTEEAANK
ncbi:MAG: glucosaminidase domain-containing protein [Magnetococcales bacterium]|nr:glucosaminidase domain-containing protein [Magnetococcales bacterium]